VERPRHVAIITDGNGRWAEERDLPISAGHEAAADTLKERLADAIMLGVEQLTVYVFSAENWARPVGEVQALMEVFRKRLAKETPELRRQGIRMRFVGAREGLSQELLQQMDDAQTLTQHNERLALFIALNYGGRAEILQAAKKFDGDTEQEFREHLYDPQMRDPELIIRTGRERRLSNFLLWQAAYSELVFRDELWPDFTREHLEEALAEFRRRVRRYGGR
jgi:undecaprenyl diphosphate synthase